MSKSRSKAALRMQDRMIDELIGISRGVVADGVVDEKEAIFLGQWIENHREVANRWPVNVLYARITEMLRDGVLNVAEQGELLQTLQQLTGTDAFIETRATTLPLDRPAPGIEFRDRTFCLTGRFAFGTTYECEETIADLGGSLVETPGRGTDYLVIGELPSPDWAHATFGRSIEKAIELRDAGFPIHIVSEEHWVNCIGDAV